MLKSEICVMQSIIEALTLCWITNYAIFCKKKKKVICQLEKLSRCKSNYDFFFMEDI